MESYILITGGAGYIGSITAHKLSEFGYKTIVYDDLSNGHRNAIPKDSFFIKGDIGDYKKLNSIFTKYKIRVIIHFAGKIIAEESVKNPAEYFKNNVVKGTNLLNSAVKSKIRNFVYSSSAGVYGISKKNAIKENFPKKPVNPYGITKLIFEQILDNYKNSYGLNYISLRYFNAAGASLDGTRGEDHKIESHLIPNALLTALGKIKKFKIYGNKYPTKDGAAVRDFVHVEDLAIAHILALQKLEKSNYSDAYNLGTNKGVSVLEILHSVENITNKKLKIEVSQNRAGDVPVLVADAKKANKELKWKPKYSDINTIIETAWLWHKNNPNGYKK